VPDFSRTIATLQSRTAEDRPAFLGTAFAFRHRRAFLTAAHCVHGFEASDLAVQSPHLSGGALLPVTSVVRHTTADLALVTVDAPNIPPGIPFHILTDLMHKPLKVLCKLGGWKSHETLLECYQQPDEEQMREALAGRRRATG
jgi:hypothetical protein